ncbi:MAG: LacI family transcriptional regulator, partial [Firmicutes bacterium]|nr:LacI family transcriptional regulator [Bacillota bacterium]
MPTIKEIAQKAGVATSTVSRVLNNSTLISEETRERVLRVMREQNYIPNSMARGLSSQRTYAVALLVNIEDSQAFNNPFFYEIMHGIETVVYQHELSLVIANQQKSGDDRLDWLIQ